MPARVRRDDVESEARLGLLQAVDRYDGGPVPFPAYARQRVVGQIQTWAKGEIARGRRYPSLDAMLAEGKIGGERPNAVDFQVAPSVRLMLCFDQLREPIDARPAGQFARKLVPDYPGRFKAVFPTEWMPF